MLTCWCDVDPNASLEKLKEKVIKLKSTAANVDILVIEHVKSFYSAVMIKLGIGN